LFSAHASSACWATEPFSGIEPLHEGWAGEGCVRAGKQGAGFVEVAVRVVCVADAFDPNAAAASGDEQLRHLDEALHARAGE
jgi:hypothetical protein